MFIFCVCQSVYMSPRLTHKTIYFIQKQKNIQFGNVTCISCAIETVIRNSWLRDCLTFVTVSCGHFMPLRQEKPSLDKLKGLVPNLEGRYDLSSTIFEDSHSSAR